jgi:hypothetical protein
MSWQAPLPNLPDPAIGSARLFDDDLVEPLPGFNGGNLHGMFISSPWIRMMRSPKQRCPLLSASDL